MPARQNQNPNAPRPLGPMEEFRGEVLRVVSEWGKYGDWVSLRVKRTKKQADEPVEFGMAGNANMQPIAGDLFVARGRWFQTRDYGKQVQQAKIEIFPADLLGFMDWATRPPAEGGAPGWGKEKKGMLRILWETADNPDDERIWTVLKNAKTPEKFQKLLNRFTWCFGEAHRIGKLKTLPTPAQIQTLTKALDEAFRVQLATNPALIQLLNRGFGFKNSLNIAQKFGDDVEEVWDRNPYEFLVVPRVTYAVVTRAMDTSLMNGDNRFPFGCWQRVSGKAADLLQKVADAKGDTRVATRRPEYIQAGMKVPTMADAIDIAAEYERGNRRLRDYFYECLEKGGAVVPADGPDGESFCALPWYYYAEESIAVFMGLMEPTKREERHGTI